MLILGVCTSQDAGAALIKDGKILAAVNEERLNRKKMTDGIPVKTLDVIWDVAGVRPDEVDRIAVATCLLQGDQPVNNDLLSGDGKEPPGLKAAEFIDSLPLGSALLKSPLVVEFCRFVMPVLARKNAVLLIRHLRSLGLRAPIRFYDHHDCHIAAAYLNSPWKDCLVISNDGFGDLLCSKIGICRDGRISTCGNNPFYNSLGSYYNYATRFCGFKKSYHAGKTMGLAAYGDASKTIGIFEKLIRWDPKRGRYISYGPLFRRGLRLVHELLKGFSREDAAAGIQRHFENILLSQARHYFEKTGIPHICLTGGLHANVRANQIIAEIPGVKGVFVFPHMGDGGLSVGAASMAWHRCRPAEARPVKMESAYLGPSFTEEEIVAELKKRKMKYSRPEKIERLAAERLRDGKVVARCDGRMEYGPRALGNRSILYPATDKKVNTWLNSRLRRTEFMPFAPVLRDIDAPSFLQNWTPVTEHTSQFMTITYAVTERCKREAPAVVHLDGTARPQVIRREVNPSYYRILDEYKSLTGLSVLVNTSFNMHEEPIVCGPGEAIQSFIRSNLDTLILGPCVVEKQQSRRS